MLELEMEADSLIKEFEETRAWLAKEESKNSVPSEKELLARLCSKLEFDRTEFGVRIGRKIVDMVAERDNQIWIVEAKKRLGYNAIGQVLSYAESYGKRDGKEVVPAIVCWFGDPQLEDTCYRMGVTTFVLGERDGTDS